MVEIELQTSANRQSRKEGDEQQEQVEPVSLPARSNYVDLKRVYEFGRGNWRVMFRHQIDESSCCRIVEPESKERG